MLLALALLAAPTIPAADAACRNQFGWTPGFEGPGPDGRVLALLVHEGRLVIGGRFSAIGGTQARHIAAFDGTTWSAIGIGMDGPVIALASLGADLVAAGPFDSAGSVAASKVARWDGQAWHAVGAGPACAVNDLVVWGDDLLVGGSIPDPEYPLFEAGVVECYRDGEWTALGQTLPSPVEALAVYRDQLFATASEVVISDSLEAMAWCLRGSLWEPLAPCEIEYPCGSGPTVGDLEVVNDRLYAVGGRMGFCDSLGHRLGSGYLVSWDGDAWMSYGGLPYDYCNDMNNYALSAVLPYGDGLLLGGCFQGPCDDPPRGIAYVPSSGGPWVEPPGGDLETWACAERLCAYEDDVYAAGSFSSFAGTYAPLLARCDGAAWHPTAPSGEGITGPCVHALAYWGDRLIAGGEFAMAGAVPTRNIVMRVEEEWQPLGLGISGPVHLILPWRDGLIAAGAFDSAGAVPARNIALWNGTAWEPLGDGLEGTSRYPVAHACSYDGDLIVARGNGGNAVRWDGATWTDLSPMTRIGDLIVHDGILYASSATGLCEWDGSEWCPIPGGPEGPVVLDVWARGLLVVAPPKVLLYDGEAWTEATRIPTYAYRFCDMTVLDGLLLIGGRFRGDGVSYAHLLQWDGKTWETFDGGDASGDVRALAWTPGSDLAVAGTFLSIGGCSSSRIAFWPHPISMPEPTALGTLAAHRSEDGVHIECEAVEDFSISLLLCREDANGNRVPVDIGATREGSRAHWHDAQAPLGRLTYWIEQRSPIGSHIQWNGPIEVEGAVEIWPFDRLRARPVPSLHGNVFSFQLPAPGRVTLSIYDLTGRRIASVYDGDLGLGPWEIEWDGRDRTGRRVSAGVYLARVEWQGVQQAARVFLLP
jgi:hypothetical protein